MFGRRALARLALLLMFVVVGTSLPWGDGRLGPIGPRPVAAASWWSGSLSWTAAQWASPYYTLSAPSPVFPANVPVWFAMTVTNTDTYNTTAGPGDGGGYAQQGYPIVGDYRAMCNPGGPTGTVTVGCSGSFVTPDAAHGGDRSWPMRLECETWRAADQACTVTWVFSLAPLLPGEVPPPGTEQNENGATGGDPVQTFSGALHYAHTDLAIPGRGPSPTFTRSYSSADTRVGRLGPGWIDNFAARLRSPADSTADLLLVNPDGNTDRYIVNAQGTFSPPPASYASLVRNADGTYTVTQRDQSRWTFSSSGDLASVSDRYGNTSALTYNGSGDLTAISDPAGRGSLSLAYTNGRLTSVADWASPARTVTYQYDTSGRLWKVTDREGQTTTFGYDGTLARITTITDARAHVALTLTYDSQGRVATQKDAKGLVSGDVTTFGYVVNGDGTRVTTLTEPATSFEMSFHPTIEDTYDANGWVTKRISKPSTSEALTETYGYDPTGNRTSVTDPRGNQTNYCYDVNYAGSAISGSRGNLTRLIAPPPTLGSNRPVTLLAYDVKNNLVQTVTPKGVPSGTSVTCSTDLSAITTAYATDHGYDASGVTLVSTTSRFTDPDTGLKTATTKYEYGDAANPGVVTKVIPARGNTGGSPDYSYATSLTYFTTGSKAGQLSSVVDALGDTTTYDYDAVGRLVSRVDPNGNSAGGIPADHTTTYAYDKEDRVRFVNRPAPATGGSSLATETRYDEVGNPTVRIDANGQVTTYAYDERDGLFQVKESPNAWTNPASPPAGIITTEYGYDSAGNLTRMTRAKGDAPNERVTDYAFDGRHLVRRETQYPSWPTTTPTLVTTSSYDPNGNGLTIVDPLGKTTTDGYDALNRLTSVDYSDASTPDVAYGYDANSNRTSMADGTGSTGYVYDEANRLTSTTTAGPKTVGYRYDLDGNRTKLIYPDATAVSYAFNKASQLASLSDWASRVTSYSYNVDGSVKDVTNPNGTVATYGYDNATRLTAIVNKLGSSIIDQRLYALDSVGNVISVGGGDRTTAASTTTAGSTGNAQSNHASISADGRYLVFDSTATNLVANDTNAVSDVFIRDRFTGTTSLVSATATGTAGNGSSSDPDISADGRWVTFRSQASNFVSGDANGASWDIFVKDLQTGAIERVSTTAAGGGTTYAADTFTRTGAGWGTADTGGAWTSTNTTNITTNGTSGVVSLPSVTSYYTRLPASVADQEGALRVKVSSLTGSGSVGYARIEPRFNAALANYYRFQTQFGASGSVDMSLRRVAGGVVTTFRTDTAVVTGLTAGSYIWVKWSVVTSGADVVLKYKLWKDGTSEPASWSTAYTDVAPGSAFTGAGTLQITSQVLAGFTGTFPFVMTYDDLSITSPGGGGGADTTAPTVPTGLSATANGAARVDLAWTASTDAVGVQGYRIYRGGTLIATTASTTFADTGLTASTLYSYTVSAIDGAGNASAQTSAQSATTGPGPDTTAPTVPTALTATAVGSNRINLSWTASTDAVGVTSYTIRRGGTVLSQVSGSTTSFSDFSPAPSTLYSYTVSAADAAGNSSAQSTSASATTAAGGTGSDPDGASSNPVVSADGHYVAFRSDATNLVSGDTNGVGDIFLRDRQTNATTRISVSTGGTQANAASALPAISDDGRYVAYQSDATNLVSGDTNAATDIFLFDRVAATTTRVSVDSSGVQANGASQDTALSADGSTVAFGSAGTNLVSGDTNAKSDVFVRTLASGTTIRASVTNTGSQGDDTSSNSSLSADGTSVAFASLATNLVTGDTNSRSDVFIRNLTAGTTNRSSIADTAAQANDMSQDPSLTADGKTVAFEAVASNLVSNDANAASDIFVRGPSVDASTYSYDRLYRLTGVAGIDGSPIYGYDPVGNRASKVLAGATTNYAYDRADRISAAGATSITVNANGNTTAEGADTFTYDQPNRLKTATVSGTTETYAYDGDGIRFSRQVGGGTPIRYVSDVNRSLPVTIDDGSRKYVYGLGLAYAVSGSIIEVYHTDRLGSVRAITDSTGAVAASYRTDEWGNPTSTTGLSPQPFHFTGEPEDATGLTYVRARYYDPSLGRFTSRDTWHGIVQIPRSLNDYAYLTDNPLGGADPDGHCGPPCAFAGGVIGGSAGLVGYLIGGVVSGDGVDLGHAIVATVAGGTTGAVCGVTLGVACVATGAATAVVQYGFSPGAGNPLTDPVPYVVNAIVGGTLGRLTGGAIFTPMSGWMQFGSELVPSLFERFVMNNSAFGIQGILQASLWSGLKSLFASSAYDYAGNVLHDAMAASALKGGH
jgi:RHS repeat-associated protein